MNSDDYCEYVWANEAQILIDLGITDGQIGTVHPPHNSKSGELHIYDSEWKFMTDASYEIKT